MRTPEIIPEAPPSPSTTVAVLGAGPAGLACASELIAQGIKVVVIDKNSRVGGLSRTEEFKGHLFDVGPHRFYTKNKEVEEFWKKYAGSDLIRVKRLTRILYRSRLLHYPLRPFDALRGMGLWGSLRAVASYLWAKLNPPPSPPENFEEWVVSKFGRVLYEEFFRTYTEKIWGIPCREVGAEWAAQRIKGLSLGGVIRQALRLGPRSKAKSLIDEFYYTKRGAGAVYENIARAFVASGGELILGAQVTALERSGSIITAVVYSDQEGATVKLPVSHVFSSIPLTNLILALDPPPPESVAVSARTLYYRDHITVNLILPREGVFPDQWIYIHTPHLKMARISEYGNFYEGMSTPTTSAISVEYFCFASDPIWKMSDAEITDMALRELRIAGLSGEKECLGSYVVREPSSYPAYYVGHRQYFSALKDYLSEFGNVTAIGRGGMYKYNNQDHSILSGLLAARSFFGEKVDIWEVNTDPEYLEESAAS